jgi:hypothetical protein
MTYLRYWLRLRGPEKSATALALDMITYKRTYWQSGLLTGDKDVSQGWNVRR